MVPISLEVAKVVTSTATTAILAPTIAVLRMIRILAFILPTTTAATTVTPARKMTSAVTANAAAELRSIATTVAVVPTAAWMVFACTIRVVVLAKQTGIAKMAINVRKTTASMAAAKIIICRPVLPVTTETLVLRTILARRMEFARLEPRRLAVG